MPVTLGPTALMLALRNGHDGVAGMLLDKKADPLLVDQFQKSAAMFALEFGHVKMVALKRIIETFKDGDFEKRDDFGHNLIMYAALAGAPDIVDTLLRLDTDGSALLAKVKDGEHDDLDLLALSAKHGKGPVIGQLLASHRKALLLDLSKNNEKTGARAKSQKDVTAGKHTKCARPLHRPDRALRSSLL